MNCWEVFCVECQFVAKARSQSWFDICSPASFYFGQFALLYVVFVIADFPVSILYFFSGTGVFSYVSDRIYLPYLIHGCFGTMWWFFISFFLCLFVKRRSLLKRAN